MSLLKTIQMFVAQNPGLTNKQIAAALTEYDIQSVQRAVCRLVDTKRATRKHAGKCYRYYAEPPADCHFEVFEPTPEVSALMETAKCLESKGLFHRAATIYMQASACQLLNQSEQQFWQNVSAVLAWLNQRLFLKTGAIWLVDFREVVNGLFTDLR